ncbi:elongation factor Ts [Candidatus Pantoea edessiphila]|uniref:Elongation factor Ts n=1 Tax=Candidatus Pantoea edessiphila TaxID=2044610 RepID=A0A2P5SY02_9GAMM|nr:translation elongation factor Ts [Candidatus Pantoea edessiphila]MBK4775568.1 elongation factor Ts [Pantoea sp. Edef]PPI87221.1 elongation factor Ts [Candidatus Pantoea edessiphila]
MSEINAALIKKLREYTGAGIMECKKALIEVNGDIHLAIEYMRKSSSIKALKKVNNVAVNGIIRVKIFGNYGVILELNCETDFVTKNICFLNFADKLTNCVVLNPEINLVSLKKQFEEERISLVAKIGENIQINRLSILQGAELGCYLHRDRIGVLVSGYNISKNLIKNIAMHIAASNPIFIKPEDIPNNIIEKEREIQIVIAKKSTKSREIAEKIVEGRMRKFENEISLIGQIFVMDHNKTINDVLQEQDAEIIEFIRFEVGEQLEKNNMHYIKE